MDGSEIIDGQGRDPAVRQALSRAERAGRLRRLAPGIYTDNLAVPPARVVACNVMNIAAILQPGGILHARSGIDLWPIAVGGERHLFVSGRTEGVTRLEGAVIHRSRGPGVLEGDRPFLDIHAPSMARRCLENLVPSRIRQGGPGIRRTVGSEGVRILLGRFLAQTGRIGLEQEHDRARRICGVLGLERQAEEMESIVADLLES